MITIRSLSRCTWEQTLQLWNEAFADYFVNMNFTFDRLMNRMVREKISPAHSLVSWADGRPVEYFGFRKSTLEDMDQIVVWLKENVLNQDTDLSCVKEHVYMELRKRQLEPPTQGRMERFLRSVIRQHEEEFFHKTYEQITEQSMRQMDRLIYLWTEEENDLSSLGEEEMPITFREIVADPGRVGLDSIFQEIKKLRTIRKLELPENLFSNLPPSKKI